MFLYFSESRFCRAKRVTVLILIILIALGAGGFYVYKNIIVPEMEEEKIPALTEEGGIPTAIYDDAVWDNSGTKVAVTKVILTAAGEPWQVATFSWEEQ